MLVNSWHRTLALIWLALVLAALGYLIQVSVQRDLLQTNMFAFLPPLAQRQTLQPAIEAYTSQNNQQLVVLLESDSPAELTGAATALTTALTDNEIWKLSLDQKADPGQFWHDYLPYAGSLLSRRDAEVLQSGDFNAFLRNVSLGYATPMALSGALLQDDPLFLLQNFLQEASGGGSVFRMLNGWPLLENDKSAALILPFYTTLDVYDLNANSRLAGGVAQAKQQLLLDYPDVRMSALGAALYVHHSVSQSRREVSIVGVGSIVAILLLFLWWLRSPLPLLASLLTLGAGLLVAFALMVAMFGSVHLVALVFCSTVLGMGIDYALHFFAHRKHGLSGFDSLRRIVTPSGMGMLTSALAFLALALVPFPGFRQVALMSSIGLVSVWISVMLWLPYMAFGLRLQPVPFQANHWLNIAPIKKTSLAILVLVLALCMVPGVLQLTPQDDIRLLQATHSTLRDAEERLQHWLGFRPEAAYFLITGNSEQDALDNMQMLCDQLRQLSPVKAQRARCLTDWLPGPQRQRQNHQLLARLAQDQSVWNGLLDLGLQPELLQRYREQLQQRLSVLGIDAFLASSASAANGFLWLGQFDSMVAGVVQVSGVGDSTELELLASQLPGVNWIDPVSEFSAMFRQFRQQGALYVFASYLLLLLSLAFRYGLRGAVAVSWPVLLAVIVVLGVSGYAGLPFNLFSVLALILVAGMGIDYGIFLREGDASHPSRVAVMMSAATTLLAFGLLALSQTIAVRSFGIVVLIGVSVVLMGTLLTYSTTKEDGRT